MSMNKLCVVITVILLFVVQSCKKDKDIEAVVNNEKSSVSNIYEEKNLDEYLTAFFDKIKTPTRNGESLSVEDAMWHLTACLNFKYCNINVCKSQVEYDTIVTSININDGAISLNDIGRSFDEISAEVGEVYRSSKLKDKNILYIMPTIVDDKTRGNSTVETVVAMSNTLDFGNYYFDNENTPLSLFPEYVTYRWDTDAIDMLEYCINLYYHEVEEIPGRVYITNTTIINCYYREEGFYNRLYHTRMSDHTYLDREYMAYYLDSYLGLIRELNPNNFRLSCVCAEITPNYGDLPGREELTFHHTLDITYGIVSYTSNPSVPPLN